MTADPDGASDGPSVRQLQIQLATLLAGIEDLREEWDATIELARHLRAQRKHSADTAAVIADMEAIMRASAAFPTATHRFTSLDDLQPAIRRAQKTYDNLLAQHLTYAENYLDN